MFPSIPFPSLWNYLTDIIGSGSHGAVVSAVAFQQEGPAGWNLLHSWRSTCVEFACSLHVCICFPPNALVSSSSYKDNILKKITGKLFDYKLPVGIGMNSCLSICQLCGRLASCPMFHNLALDKMAKTLDV